MSPLLALSGFFCLGIICAFFLALPFIPLFIITAAVLAIIFISDRSGGQARVRLALLSFLIGCCCISAHLLPGAKAIDRQGPSARVSATGIVLEKPEARAGGWRLILAAEEIVKNGRGRECRGKLLVFVKGRATCVAGDRVRVDGELVPGAAAIRSRGYLDYLANHGVACVLACRPWEIAVLENNADGKAAALLRALKIRFSRCLDERLSPQASAMMRAMILGEKERVSPVIRRAMVNSGTVHILVVSGFNVGIVAFMLLALLKFLAVPRRLRFLFLLPNVVIYCLLTGANEPVVRSGIMAAILGGAGLAARDGDIHNAFALALWLMLLVNPRLMFDAGFQLSFASVLSLITLYPAFRRFFAPERLKHAFPRFLAEGLLVSAAAWLGTAGFVAYYFRLFAPGAVLVNLLAAPLAGFITLCGFSLILADAALPFLARYFALTADYAVFLLVQVVSFRFPVFPLPGAETLFR